MGKTSQPKPLQFNIRLSVKDRDRLNWLAHDKELNPADVVRELLRKEYARLNPEAKPL